MGNFTKISQAAFNEFQLDAGILVRNFSTINPEIKDEDIICATTGGINITCAPSYSDLGEDVDNCPANTKELKQLDGWDVSIGFTALSITGDTIKMALGVAEKAAPEGSNAADVKPRNNLDQADFQNIWWIGDVSDGGLVAAELKNVLSTSGLSLQTSNKGKGQLSVTLTAHPSITNPDEVPVAFLVRPKTATATAQAEAEE